MAAQTITKIGNAFLAVFLIHFSAVVAGVACPLGQVGLVTIGAGVIFLAMIHRESVRAVITRRGPGASAVAGRASLPWEHARMKNGFLVTSRAFTGCTLENLILVAIGALHINMRTIQRESGKTVVESGIFPISRVVAGFASRSVLPVMLILVLMARVAIFWGALVAAGMTLLTFHVKMLAFQREITQAVIKFCWLPGFGGTVADATLRAKLTLMRIIFKMTGFTSCGCILQISNATGIEMAPGTVHPQVRSR